MITTLRAALRELYDKDKIVRFWELALPPAANNRTTTALNVRLLLEIGELPEIMEANRKFEEFIRTNISAPN